MDGIRRPGDPLPHVARRGHAAARAGRRTSPCRPGRPRRRRGAARAASQPDATPPTPTIGNSGCAAWTSCTARTATGWIAGPDSPPPPAPSTGCFVSRVVRQPEQRVDARDRLGARCGDSTGDVDDAVRVGAELGPARPPATGGRVDHPRRQLGVVGEDRVATLEVRARQVDLDGHDLRRVLRPAGRRPPRSRRPSAPRWRPRRLHRCAAGRAARGRASTGCPAPATRPR